MEHFFQDLINLIFVENQIIAMIKFNSILQISIIIIQRFNAKTDDFLICASMQAINIESMLIYFNEFGKILGVSSFLFN